MKALFIAPPSHEPCLIVEAWTSFNEPAVHKKFDVWGEPDDEGILNIARDTAPDVIFYIGANKASGLPGLDTFRELRIIAPSVHLCWDAADSGWRRTLCNYRGCFDLQVAMDGVPGPFVDMATLTPIDPRPYQVTSTLNRRARRRRIRCAFAGQDAGLAGPGQYQHPRHTMLGSLVARGVVEYRPREATPYDDYVRYIKSCQMLINFSHTGSGKRHHCKVRITEAGMAGCALLEMDEAPTRNWIPEECLFIYHDLDEAEQIIRSATSSEMAGKVSALRSYVQEHHSAQRIYASILARL